MFQHNAAKHPQFACTKCHTAFLTQASLEDHYRGKPSAIHPKCSRCGKGFYSQSSLTEHHQTAHPTVICCGQKVYEEDLPKHYNQSERHPSCTVCDMAFEDDAAYNAHGATEHPDQRCSSCRRQFATTDELKKHFEVSPNHPTCGKCNLGFFDDTSFLEVGFSKLTNFRLTYMRTA
ncbi:hypothetical protein DFH07DRAFT_760449 [Mycena maculata]|uniref:C2H2-type domain-containing protein n=1 Tax=Mycena maculata TaxID=230809 RepID=A0AAD7HI98_9AGAR|nr:hypothetical protein DFH07DRAFT_760449 [Mycena maculata]